MPRPINVVSAGNGTKVTPTLDQIDVAALVSRVQESQDSAALSVLIDNTTGYYLGVVNKYAQAYPQVIRRADLADDKMFNIYRFILDYDPTRGAKLSTYITSRTDWMCKDLLDKEQNNPIKVGSYSATGNMSLGAVSDTYTTTHGDLVTLEDESDSAKVVEEADKDLKIEEIMGAAWQQCSDKRFVQILNYRHFSPPGKAPLTWREIGERLGLTHEACRKIYNKNITIVRNKITDHAA